MNLIVQSLNDDKSQERFLYLDIIRLLATMMVFLVHFNVKIQASYPLGKILGSTIFLNQYLGDVGVTLFIILSGASLMITKSEHFSAVSFYKKRFLSIYPPFWISYIAIAMLFILLGTTWGDGQYWKVVLSIIGLDGFFLLKMSSYYLVGEWFTGFIILVYLFFPLLRRGVINAPIITGVSLLILHILMIEFYPNSFWIPIRCNPIMRLSEFAFGMFFMNYLCKRSDSKWIYITAIVTLILCLNYKPPIHSQTFALISGVSLFLSLAYLMKNLHFPHLVEKIIKQCSLWSFLAFLLHHRIIFFLSDRVSPINFSLLEVLVYFITVVLLSFIGASLLDFPTKWLKKKLEFRLFPS